MTTENRFNLIDEAWIPISSHGLVGLRDVFQNQEYLELAANPIEKIAIAKLLLAIASSACKNSLANSEDWERLRCQGVTDKCLEYLDKWHDRFWLYGDKPFLQMQAISKATKRSLNDFVWGVSTGNGTVLTERNVQRKEFTDAELALIILVLMNFALGGKNIDNSIMLSLDYFGKFNEKGQEKKSGMPGTSLGARGFLHNFLQGETLLQTIWLNLFTSEEIAEEKIYREGFGIAPWEEMPTSENCEIAERLKNSMVGRLISLSRFCLLSGNELHYSEGILHTNYTSKMIDPTMAQNNKEKVLWVNVDKRPWRELTSLLSFMADENGDYECMQLKSCIKKAQEYAKGTKFGIWSGGLALSNNAGEQYVSGADDFVESSVMISPFLEYSKDWFNNLKREIRDLDNCAKILWKKIKDFYSAQNSDSKDKASKASNLFWQLCENKLQNLLEACVDDESARKKLRREFASLIYQIYDLYCPKDTARQIDAWAKNRPNLHKYLTE